MRVMLPLAALLLCGAMILVPRGPAGAQALPHHHGGAASEAAARVDIPPAPADAAAIAGYEAAMRRMHEQMNVPWSGNADRDFVLAMIPHHQGAVDMAQVLLQHGSDPQIRKLAEDVIRTQQAEIAMMRAWLAAHPK
ncbi:conserved exported protein of unknown function [Rhodovastum atsumiense]|uniref:DUF305 domain-containing protein n=1 Tax=Rhodovastum atsumiense TaxID=504468 RepID=A0A5M6IVV3_9PROT|nr:DUF305 domain-containing protein [Rhodovastum atsumiense]KAA5612351.1 DUF305 domain-containing protein [Rhodovastum atsumiense]CAH2601684.1 conserved exported protein of unknown function [Rhodovastum atsumiense]